MQVSDYMLLDAVRETDRLLRYTITHFFEALTFTLPPAEELQESSEMGWPSVYDDLIVEGAVILLSPSDYATTEQAKKYWQSKVIELTGEKNADIPLVGYDDTLDTSEAATPYMRATLPLGTLGYTTKDIMDADLDFSAGTLAIVTLDSTPANNGLYIKEGATGAGPWTKSPYGIADIIGDGKKYKIVACVVRGIGGVWAPLTTGGHVPLNIASVTQTSTTVNINYSFTAKNVVSFVACPDEAFVNNGYNFGASVGLSSALITCSRDARTIGGYVYYTGTGWVAVNESGTGNASGAFAANTLTITHDSIANTIVTAVNRDASLRVAPGSLGSTTTPINFYDAAGAIVTAPNTNMKLYWSRSESRRTSIDPATINITGSNIWCFGIFEV